MKPCVFIHTNERQMLGALVGEYALRRNSAHADEFDVRILHTDDHPFLAEREGQSYLRSGGHRPWHMEDLQSFTPLRFQPPAEMGYEGRALLTDPDVFAVGDVWELLSRDMQGKAVLCRPAHGAKGRAGIRASSVMLLDCEKLTHWRCAEGFHEMFEDKRDYTDWIGLLLEPEGSIGDLEDEWNDLDHLTPATKMLHNTKRYTQPWKSGLPIDFTPAEKTRTFPPLGWYRQARRKLFGLRNLGHYRPHPDPAQERHFFGLLRECLDAGVVSEARLREAMKQNHLRHDAFELIERAAKEAA